MRTIGNDESGGPGMRISSGFDRMSTEEELHQVLDILGELGRNGWMLPQETATAQTNCLWADAPADDAESLAELIEKKPELKN